jgi:predicted permease
MHGSFIFQLPVELLLLECHALEQERFEALAAACEEEREEGCSVGGLECRRAVDTGVVTSRWGLWAGFASRPAVWLCVGTKVVQNPVIAALAAGFVISLTGLGPTYLRPTSEDFVPGLGWVAATLGWLGACVSPVSLFAMGVWMQAEGRRLVRLEPWLMVLCMLSKLVLVPLVLVGLAKWFGLDDEAGRAAVLIGSLPISQASFTLGEKFKVGEALLAANVFLGTVLMLPTVVVWNVALDALGLFPVEMAEPGLCG